MSCIMKLISDFAVYSASAVESFSLKADTVNGPLIVFTVQTSPGGTLCEVHLLFLSLSVTFTMTFV